MPEKQEPTTKSEKCQEGASETSAVKPYSWADSSYWLLPRSSSFWLTRIFFLRSLAFIYFVAFLVAYNENEALLGPRGLLPVDSFLHKVSRNFGASSSFYEQFSTLPTLLWGTDLSPSTIATGLDLIAMLGLILSGWVVVNGSANMIIMFVLWILYHSLVSVGQQWYSFGWESQLLESGFLAIFMCPFLSLEKMPKTLPTPEVAVIGYRWLLFRIMIGAGLIKIRGDKCWRDLTCMHYHYETQPVPNPVSTFYHQLPDWWHMFETASNHFIELPAPFLLLALPFRRLVILGGIFQVIFQAVLISSGNLSFLNWLTILPAIFCFDDKFLQCFFSKSALLHLRTAQMSCNFGFSNLPTLKKLRSLIYSASHWIIFGLIAYLSIPIVQNLMSSRQIMNTSFDSFRLVNTYGAFGSITKHRTEVVFEGTLSANPNDRKATWLEYEFPCKPGNVSRCPCLISPYHYRLDWLMWFAAFQSYQHNPWLIHLAGKMLDNDVRTLSPLLAVNPFEYSAEKPRWIRARHYSYSYSKIGSAEWNKGQWWVRKDDIGNFYLPPVNREMLRDVYKQLGWKN